MVASALGNHQSPQDMKTGLFCEKELDNGDIDYLHYLHYQALFNMCDNEPFRYNKYS